MSRPTRYVPRQNPVVERVDRRMGAIVVSIVYVSLGLAYTFRWGPVVRHVPSLWIAPGDLLSTYGTAIQMAQLHFSNVYQPGRGFLSYPGFLVALAPLAAVNNVFHGTWIDVKVHHHLVAHPQVFLAPHLPSGFWYQGNLGPNLSHGTEQVIQAQAFPFLILVGLVYSCLALFACDALAERLQVERQRRAVLGVAEAVVLWNATIIFGHPEDAVALAFAIYALLFAMDGRFVGAGWLFGVALAFQPLVLMAFPILLVMGGKRRAVGLALRGVAPAAAVTAPPLIAAFHDTVHALVTQPTFPDVSSAHQTPWTFLAPKMGGRGKGTRVGGGPPRIAVFVLAAGFGWWARRWRERPEMMAWALAAALSIRIYLETVMYSYYVWPALAVALAVAARGSRRRFAVAIALAIAITVVGQWHMGWLEWWAVDAAGVTGLLVAASRPEPLMPPGRRGVAGRARTPAVAQGRSGAKGTAKKSVPGPARTPAVAQGRSGAKGTAKKSVPGPARTPAVAQGRSGAAKKTAQKKGASADGDPKRPVRR